MSISVKEFKREYLKALRDGTAAIFAGAGLSRPSGFLDWKELLRSIAEDLGLNINRETDLVALAQYHYNEKGGNRAKLNQAIIEEFTKEAKENENLKILARLPINTYWTTNYDKLIETILSQINKKADVKISQENLAQSVPCRDAIVYKMHGDVGTPEKAVITKDDYEAYNINRSLFSVNLQGDLISKTFLFIGFSFEDPNLAYILSRIRVLLGENKRDHYCFFKKIKKEDYNNDEDFNYAMVKQDLRVNDLKRYSINAILIDDYSDITNILKDIECKYKIDNVFISGSAKEYGKFQEDNAIKLMHNMSKKLVHKNYKIISGFGLGVGSYIINGALEEIFNSKYRHVDDHLLLRPFPQFRSGSKELKNLWSDYRREMINEAGVVIFIFGNKAGESGKVVNANGMLEEYRIAKNQDKYIIPIASTDYIARIIYDEVKQDQDKYWYLMDSLGILEHEFNPEKIILEIVKIIERIKK